MKVFRTTGLFLVIAAAQPAHVHADTLTFRGTALPTCALITPTDGVLALGADLKSWATAVPATITAVNTAPATVTVTRPTSWQTSPASTPPTTFSHLALMSGVNIGTLLGVSDARTGLLSALGTTVVAVSLGATASQPYPSGTYEAQVTVTCTVP